MCLIDIRVLSWCTRCWCEQEHLKYLQHRVSQRPSAALVALSASGEFGWHGTPAPRSLPSRVCVRRACGAQAAPVSPAQAHGMRASPTLCSALVVCYDSCEPLFAGSRHAMRTSRPTLPEVSWGNFMAVDTMVPVSRAGSAAAGDGRAEGLAC